MKFETTRFGEIEYPEEVMMIFPEGVLGFPNDTHYLLLEHNAEGSPFKWLQSLDNPDLAFIVVDPAMLDPRYQFDIDLDTERIVKAVSTAQCAVMCIVNVPRDHPIRMTANLKAPLVVNVELRIGRQVVLGSQAYAISTPIFPHLTDQEESNIPQRVAS